MSRTSLPWISNKELLQERILISKASHTKPLLKWAGGKSQLTRELEARAPRSYGKYIEPFFGGGALYFHLQPNSAVIADSNPELINLYKVVAKFPEELICELKKFKNKKGLFLKVRDQDWTKLSAVKAAARTIFLNKTCFNGLYRVNKSGKFNVPFANYKDPKLADERTIFAASRLLKGATIVSGDYKEILRKYARKGDFIFLDPPYLPISKYSDFKRYTKEQFYEEDHIELAVEVKRLHDLGCHVILTNSNHPLVHNLYSSYEIEIIQTKRFINSNAAKRIGEDVIVNALPAKRSDIRPGMSLSPQIEKFPATRYMGSKNKLLDSIWGVSSQFKFESVLDLFSGSGAVSYMFKAEGKSVIANDYMHMASTYAKALIENNKTKLNKNDIELLTDQDREPTDTFVADTFKGLYFTDRENRFIDRIRSNSKKLTGYKRHIALTALMRACVKKRPRGIFTYVGQRYDDGRRDLKISFQDQFLEAINLINNAVFDNGRVNTSLCGDALTISETADLVYIDPPYFSPLSDNEYVRRYHFVEGIARDWKGVEIQNHTLTKKFKSYPTPFSSLNGAIEAFDLLFRKHQNSILLVSYSSNSLPRLDQMVGLISKYKKNVEVLPVDYKYSFGNQSHKSGNQNNSVKEYLFIGY